tara:strand:- start:96 stop:449 length:354 start_codon:yes stop_codon:yes gene_type:complete
MGRKFRVKENVCTGSVDYDIDLEFFVGDEWKECFSDIFYKGDVYVVMNDHIMNEFSTEEDGELIEPELMCIEGKSKISMEEVLDMNTCEDDLYYSTIGMEYSSFYWESVKGYFELID